MTLTTAPSPPLPTPDAPTAIGRAFCCRGCGQDQPRSGYCRECRRKYQRQYRRRNRSSAMHKYAEALAKVDDLRKVKALAVAMIRRFNGVENIADAWKREFDYVTQTAPGSRRAWNYIASLLNYMRFAEDNPPKPNLAALTDEELDELKVEALLDLIRERPQVAVTAAKALGWIVIQPGE